MIHSKYYPTADDEECLLEPYRFIDLPGDLQVTHRLETTEMRELYSTYHGEPIEIGIENDTLGPMRFKVIIQNVVAFDAEDGNEYVRVVMSRVSGSG